MPGFSTRFLCSGGLLLCVPTLLGCGISLCEVSGVVSIDGKPAPPGMKIAFTPRGRDAEPTLAMTENEGRYLVIDRTGRPGLRAGSYTVSLGFWGDPSMNPPGLADLKIPEEFRDGSSTLVCEARGGRLEFNIDVRRK